VFPRSELRNRVVILVDDGLATGATMRAAVRSVRTKHPARLVVAVPVGSESACSALRAEADEVIRLYEPELFWGVGAFYEHFEPTEDTQVQQILREFSTVRSTPRKRAFQRGHGRVTQ